jgi:hypothetical protein
VTFFSLKRRAERTQPLMLTAIFVTFEYLEKVKSELNNPMPTPTNYWLQIDTMASRPPGKRTTAVKERKTWRMGGKQKSPSPSPFDSDKKYRSGTTYGNSSPLIGKKGFNLPRRPGVGERERTSTGDVSFGGTYRDRQVSQFEYEKEICSHLKLCDHSHCIN